MGKELAQKITGGKLSWGTRLSYASGDVACNVVFGMIGTLLTLFYTDYVGISPYQFQMGKIKTVDPLDERTLCFVGSSAVHSAAYHRNASVPLSVRNL